MGAVIPVLDSRLLQPFGGFFKLDFPERQPVRNPDPLPSVGAAPPASPFHAAIYFTPGLLTKGGKPGASVEPRSSAPRSAVAPAAGRLPGAPDQPHLPGRRACFQGSGPAGTPGLPGPWCRPRVPPPTAPAPVRTTLCGLCRASVLEPRRSWSTRLPVLPAPDRHVYWGRYGGGSRAERRLLKGPVTEHGRRRRSGLRGARGAEQVWEAGGGWSRAGLRGAGWSAGSAGESLGSGLHSGQSSA